MELDIFYVQEAEAIALSHGVCSSNSDCIEVSISFSCPAGGSESPCTKAIVESERENVFEELYRLQDLLCQCLDGSFMASGDCVERIPICVEEKCEWITAADPDSFSIYLLKDQELSPFDVEGIELNELELQDTALLSMMDVVSYNWESHTVRLTDEGLAKMPTGMEDFRVAGPPFVVVASGQRQYLGAFWSNASSSSWSHPVIILEYGSGQREFGIECGYVAPCENPPDPRNSAAIREALEIAHRLN